MEADRKRMHGELAAREQALAEARTVGAGEVQRLNELLAAAEKRDAERGAQIAQLQAEAETHEQEMTVLMAHLNEARRPVQSIQADVKRLNDELALKTAALEQLNEDNRSLRGALERTRGALEEREFLIRRLERSESNNANVLGRIQTSIERLGAAPVSSASPSVAEYTAELIRIDGDHNTTYPVVRRTRIGRALGCELQIDSSSVSRHHALLLQGARELIIEDLNSTNGVVVNGPQGLPPDLEGRRSGDDRGYPVPLRPQSDAASGGCPVRGAGRGGAGRGGHAACVRSTLMCPKPIRPRRLDEFTVLWAVTLYRRRRIRYLSRPSSALSSAVEHHLDMVGVSGSIPLARTNLLTKSLVYGQYFYRVMQKDHRHSSGWGPMISGESMAFGKFRRWSAA